MKHGGKEVNSFAAIKLYMNADLADLTQTMQKNLNQTWRTIRRLGGLLI